MSARTTAQAATLLATTSETTAHGAMLQVASADGLEHSALVLPSPLTASTVVVYIRMPAAI